MSIRYRYHAFSFLMGTNSFYSLLYKSSTINYSNE